MVNWGRVRETVKNRKPSEYILADINDRVYTTVGFKVAGTHCEQVKVFKTLEDAVNCAYTLSNTVKPEFNYYFTIFDRLKFQKYTVNN